MRGKILSLSLSLGAGWSTHGFASAFALGLLRILDDNVASGSSRTVISLGGRADGFVAFVPVGRVGFVIDGHLVGH